MYAWVSTYCLAVRCICFASAHLLLGTHFLTRFVTCLSGDAVEAIVLNSYFTWEALAMRHPEQYRHREEKRKKKKRKKGKNNHALETIGLKENRE